MGADEDAPKALLSVKTLRMDISYVWAESACLLRRSRNKKPNHQRGYIMPSRNKSGTLSWLYSVISFEKSKDRKVQGNLFCLCEPSSLLSGRWVSWGGGSIPKPHSLCKRKAPSLVTHRRAGPGLRPPRCRTLSSWSPIAYIGLPSMAFAKAHLRPASRVRCGRAIGVLGYFFSLRK